MEDNLFRFRHIVTSKLKIIIRNHDNQPLSIDAIAVRGYLHNLVARFTEPGNYALYYGHKTARTPQYDIKRFTGTIPEAPGKLTLGAQQVLDKSHLATKETKPLIENQFWLWLVMGVVILLLGGFTFSMLRKV